MILNGIRYGAQIVSAAASHNLDPVLLAAVAAQETGGPGSNSGSNIVGDGGHGHGVFQIDDRSWAFARDPAAMDPAKNAEMAASMLQDNLQRYGGNVTKALSAYNAGAPNAAGTRTTWADGKTLNYADSVMRHYAGILAAEQGQAVADNRETASGVNALGALALAQGSSGRVGQLSGASAAAVPLTALTQATLPQLPPVAPPPAIPAGSQAQASTNVGAQADNDVATLVDQSDVFGTAADDDT